MKLFIRILLFFLAALVANVKVISATINFPNIQEATVYSSFHTEIPKTVLKVIENDWENCCQSEQDLVYYRNLVLASNANAAKGVGLTDDVAKTFQFGRYTEVVLDKPMVLSRYYDNVNAFAKGRFMTNSTSGFTFLDRMGMAIRPSWNGMTKVAHWEFPAGSTIYQGRAAMQFPWLGGKTQYFVPELGNIKRVIR